jgi:hypothetical protein
VIRLSPNKTGDHENIFGALGFVGSRATSPLLAALRPISPQPAVLRRRSPIHALSIWSGCWRDKPRGTSFEPKRMAGNATASPSKEATA